jgi:hypothetical protein
MRAGHRIKEWMWRRVAAHPYYVWVTNGDVSEYRKKYNSYHNLGGEGEEDTRGDCNYSAYPPAGWVKGSLAPEAPTGATISGSTVA